MSYKGLFNCLWGVFLVRVWVMKVGEIPSFKLSETMFLVFWGFYGDRPQKPLKRVSGKEINKVLWWNCCRILGNDGRIEKWKCSTEASKDGVVSQWISYFWRARDWRESHAVCKWSNSFLIYPTHHKNNVAFSCGEINAGCHLWGMLTISSAKISLWRAVWTYTLGDNVFAH